MIAFGIIVIVVGILTFIWSVLSFNDEKYILTVLLFTLAIFFCTCGINFIVNKRESDEQKIECSEIKQIDTLYKNDSIVGYEVIILK